VGDLRGGVDRGPDGLVLAGTVRGHHRVRCGGLDAGTEEHGNGFVA